MQTFLPYPDFELSARALDRARLGKQRVECMQILQALERGRGAWFNHPCTQMWRGYEGALTEYAIQIACEWMRRGYADSTIWFFLERKRKFVLIPHWLGRAELHASHRSNLLRKAPAHYVRFGWTEPYNLPYVWPK